MTRQLPVTTGALIAVAAVAVLSIGGYFLLVAPKSREIARLDSQLKATAPAGRPVPPTAVSITDRERELWRELDARVRARFVAPDDQFRVLGDVAELAREAGLKVSDLGLENVQAQPPLAPTVLPAHVVVNPGLLRLKARHQFTDLIRFVEMIRQGRAYVAIQSLEVRRLNDELESDMRLITLGWAP